MDKDSYFFTDTLRKPRTSGYLVCSRPLYSESSKMHRVPSFNAEKMAPAYDPPSTNEFKAMNTSIEIESGVEFGDNLVESSENLAKSKSKLQSPKPVNPLQSPRYTSTPEKVSFDFVQELHHNRIKSQQSVFAAP